MKMNSIIQYISLAISLLIVGILISKYSNYPTGTLYYLILTIASLLLSMALIAFKKRKK
jgi:hypothetical protein